MGTFTCVSGILQLLSAQPGSLICSVVLWYTTFARMVLVNRVTYLGPGWHCRDDSRTLKNHEFSCSSGWLFYS
ncbi:uncharacterized protein B0T15DRAFT_530656 [Chaetomium strumarium]|uniref:Uncharacterized protein n=1 Tax=Chaetomium strumarium TaxID=1170767 RepID=A0AAJ0GWW2_9PEZI|nr:hypothetical protein B0T15DRAFT_530656 [Chaetomium strumarium]